jgi:hypothetical protein
MYHTFYEVRKQNEIARDKAIEKEQEAMHHLCDLLGNLDLSLRNTEEENPPQTA